jgi:FKBP-type peptidyl-prolyl cis-trans isomerase
MRSYGIIIILGLVLALIAFQARTGIFRVHSKTEQPANIYMRQVMEASQPELSTADEKLLMVRYSTAHQAPSGLRYLRRRRGTGQPPKPGAELGVHYDGYQLERPRGALCLPRRPG